MLFLPKFKSTATISLGAETPCPLFPGATGMMDLERMGVSTQGCLDGTWQSLQAQVSVVLMDDPQVSQRP